MTVTLSLFAGAGAQFFDNNGDVLSGGKLYTYQAGTTTPLATYTTNAESAFHTNPIILDSAGRVPSGGEIWLQLGVGYKFVLRTSTDVLIATYDNIPSSAQPPAANDADSIMYEQGYTVTAGNFVVGKIYRIASVGTTDFTLIGAVNNTVGTHFIATGVGTGTGTAELSQTVEAKLRETVSVKDFGAVGDGVTDDTAAIQAAINYCKANLTSFNNSVGGGWASLYFPQGMYVVSSTLNVNGAIGFTMTGAGVRSTQIVFTGSSSSLFYYNVYIYCLCQNISFTAGSVAIVGGLPQVTQQVTKNNTAFRFNGDGGGTDMVFETCQFSYFNKVFTTLDANVNDDGHQHYSCQFFTNNIVWDNTNTQAVIWSFINCKVFYNAVTVFNNPAGNMRVVGGDFINPGDFLTATLTSTGLDSSFTDLRFENYQNVPDPKPSPRLLVLSGTHTGLVFDRCSARGGGSLAGKTSATISGVFGIIMRDCVSLSGTWEISASGEEERVMSLLTLDNTRLTINQTVSPSFGNRPISINYINYPNSNQGRINRYFLGALSGQTKGVSATPMADVITFSEFVSASTISRSIPVFVQQPYGLVLSKVRFVVSNNTTNTFDLIVWKDSTKVVKLCEILAMNANGVTKVFEAAATVWPPFTSTSDPLFLEVTAAANAGNINGQISLTYDQTF
jgi:hypothetical protein